MASRDSSTAQHAPHGLSLGKQGMLVPAASRVGLAGLLTPCAACAGNTEPRGCRGQAAGGHAPLCRQHHAPVGERHGYAQAAAPAGAAPDPLS